MKRNKQKPEAHASGFATLVIDSPQRFTHRRAGVCFRHGIEVANRRISPAPFRCAQAWRWDKAFAPPPAPKRESGPASGYPDSEPLRFRYLLVSSVSYALPPFRGSTQNITEEVGSPERIETMPPHLR